MFINDVKAGNNAENIFWHFFGQISGYNILQPRRKNNDWIEGTDIESIGITDEGIKGISTEVKALLNNNFIRRDNNNLLPCGTLEFELWSNAWNEDGTLKPRIVWTPGWFQGMIHREEMREYQMMHGYDTDIHTPDQLAFMLCKDAAGKKPYACVLFNEFSKLKERLYRIAPFDLDDLRPPTHRYNFWINKQLNVPFNIWYVSLDEVVDLARIVLFEDVAIEPNYDCDCPIEIQQARCVYLTEHACLSINRKTEYQKAKNAGLAFNRDRGLPEGTKIPHMTYIDLDKLPSYVERYDACPDWLKDLN